MLENCDKVEWVYSSEILNQMYCDNYKGNAYALRGLHMMYLLRAHAGMVDGQLMGVLSIFLQKIQSLISIFHATPSRSATIRLCLILMRL